MRITITASFAILALAACGAADPPAGSEEAEELEEAAATPSDMAPRGAQQIVMEESRTVSESPAELWARIGDEACDLGSWLPGIESCELTGGTDGAVGAARALNGGIVVEEFTAWDNEAMTHTYRMTTGPFAEAGYEATLSVAPHGDDGSEVTWRIEAMPVEEAVEPMSQAFERMLANGMGGITGEASAPAPTPPEAP